MGDFKEVPTGEGKVHLAAVMDLYSRRIVGFATSNSYPTAELAQAAVEMAVATRGGDVTGVIFHSDNRTQYRDCHFFCVSGCGGVHRMWSAMRSP